MENMAAAHLIAAQRMGCRRRAPTPFRKKGQSVPDPEVAGEAFNLADFSQNIVSLCE